MQRKRGYHWSLLNPNNDYDWYNSVLLSACESKDISRYIYQLEKTTNGEKQLNGYISFTYAKTASAAQRYFTLWFDIEGKKVVVQSRIVTELQAWIACSDINARSQPERLPCHYGKPSKGQGRQKELFLVKSPYICPNCGIKMHYRAKLETDEQVADDPIWEESTWDLLGWENIIQTPQIDDFEI